VVPITAKDANFFKKVSTKPILPLPFGVDTDKIKAGTDAKPELALFHIGAMNWIPNEEGIKWFIDNVWPLVEENLPHVKLYLAGREMPEWLNKISKKNIRVVGEVESAHDFINSKAISIAPLFSGSGIRIKIIESMALGKAVISTSIGAEGINVENGKNILIANTAQDFFGAIKTLFEKPDLVQEIGDLARLLIEQEHCTLKIIMRLESFYRQIL
jgi:glycosyltransferase involved in cell wall biosynthesis